MCIRKYVVATAFCIRMFKALFSKGQKRAATGYLPQSRLVCQMVYQESDWLAKREGCDKGRLLPTSHTSTPQLTSDAVSQPLNLTPLPRDYPGAKRSCSSCRNGDSLRTAGVLMKRSSSASENLLGS